MSTTWSSVGIYFRSITLTYVMVTDFYMLCVHMEFWVMGEGDCRLIVNENRDGDTTWIFLWYTVDIWLRAMAAAFVHYRTPHAQLGWVFLCFPFCYTLNISPYRRCLVDSGRRRFFIIRQLMPNSAECSDVFPFHNVLPFLFPELFS